jgi:hypothetical protein
MLMKLTVGLSFNVHLHQFMEPFERCDAQSQRQTIASFNKRKKNVAVNLL